jgi:outer membrane protein assembly factor BamB
VVADGVVYVATNGGDVYAFDAEDGTTVASTNLGSSVYGTPCVADGVVYIGTYEDGVLHALNAVTLASEWTLDFNDYDYEQHITGSPVVYNGAVYIGTREGQFSSGFLRTVDIATRTQRNAAVTQEAPDYVTPAIDTSFASGARCYISDDSCYVTAVRCDTGAYVWDWYPDRTQFYSSPTVYGGYIFGGSTGNYIYRIIDGGNDCVEPSPFIFPAVYGAVYSTVAAYNGKLYFGNQGGSMYCVDAATFSQADWTASLGSPITSSGLISTSTGLLFICTENGMVYALNIANGTSAWSYNTSKSTIKSSLAASNGRLYVVAGDNSGHYLYCFGL